MRPNDCVDIQDIKREQSEAEFQSEVRRIALATGFMFYHTWSSRRSDPGYPDISLVHPQRGIIALAELKTQRGNVTDAQWHWLNAIARAGGRAYLWRPADMDGIADWLCGESEDAPGRIAKHGGLERKVRE